MSNSRKRWLRENPDRHPWKKNSKFVSAPCEVLKRRLIDAGLTFVEEYVPLSDRHFAIDIAFTDAKLAIEVNGNQHYDEHGTLKSYYQERHDLIEGAGWHVLELHYASCFEPHIEKTVSLINETIRSRMPPAF